MITPRFDDINLDDPRTRAIVMEALAVRLDPDDTCELGQAAVLPEWVPARPLTLLPPREDAKARRR
jgi:hypothetical protein